MGLVKGNDVEELSERRDTCEPGLCSSLHGAPGGVHEACGFPDIICIAHGWTFSVWANCGILRSFLDHLCCGHNRHARRRVACHHGRTDRPCHALQTYATSARVMDEQMGGSCVLVWIRLVEFGPSVGRSIITPLASYLRSGTLPTNNDHHMPGFQGEELQGKLYFGRFIPAP